MMTEPTLCPFLAVISIRFTYRSTASALSAPASPPAFANVTPNASEYRAKRKWTPRKLNLAVPGSGKKRLEHEAIAKEDPGSSCDTWYGRRLRRPI
jgi:hypothetical protein